jgi:alpha-ketoglutarate-dependent taurine dioxygenase
LPDDDKGLIDGLRVRHSFTSAQRKIEPDPTDKQLAQWATVPSCEHPLVWKRKDGRRSLVMGSTAEVVLDMPDGESRALLNRLLEWATQPRFTLSHSWSEGDLVIFDNTGLLHRAMPYAADSPRLMHRATVAGEEAFA